MVIQQVGGGLYISNFTGKKWSPAQMCATTRFRTKIKIIQNQIIAERRLIFTGLLTF